MIIIACVDQNNGMMFHNRRQSQDRNVRKKILQMIEGKGLWMNEYSYSQFKEEKGKIFVDDNFLERAPEGEYCFVESNQIPEEKTEKLVLFRWNKKYPSDFRLNINLEHWKLKSSLEFVGYSHEKIMKEEYEK
ncbi:MAG: ribonuclease Z [Eubacterium sp.]